MNYIIIKQRENFLILFQLYVVNVLFNVIYKTNEMEKLCSYIKSILKNLLHENVSNIENSYKNNMIYARQNGQVFTYTGSDEPFVMMPPSDKLKARQTFTIQLL